MRTLNQLILKAIGYWGLGGSKAGAAQDATVSDISPHKVWALRSLHVQLTGRHNVVIRVGHICIFGRPPHLHLRLCRLLLLLEVLVHFDGEFYQSRVLLLSQERDWPKVATVRGWRCAC